MSRSTPLKPDRVDLACQQARDRGVLRAGLGLDRADERLHPGDRRVRPAARYLRRPARGAGGDLQAQLALSLLAEPRTHVVEAQRALTPPVDPRTHVVEARGAEVAFLVAAQGDRAALGLAVSHHEHVRDLAQLRLADLAPDRLRPLV